jgi:hypothetical protein
MFNFMKGSIFSRKQSEPVLDEPKQDVQVLAVWGSPASGKTTVSVRLAKHLADQKKNVALLLCDMTAPMLPCICPPGDLECERSLGSILAATHPDQPRAPELVREYVRYGASPRGAQALVTAGKIYALLDGRFNVSVDDIRAVALPSLRHRIILNFEGEAEGITTEATIRAILDSVALPAVE